MHVREEVFIPPTQRQLWSRLPALPSCRFLQYLFADNATVLFCLVPPVPFGLLFVSGSSSSSARVVATSSGLGVRWPGLRILGSSLPFLQFWEPSWAAGELWVWAGGTGAWKPTAMGEISGQERTRREKTGRHPDRKQSLQCGTVAGSTLPPRQRKTVLDRMSLLKHRMVSTVEMTLLTHQLCNLDINSLRSGVSGLRAKWFGKQNTGQSPQMPCRSPACGSASPTHRRAKVSQDQAPGGETNRSPCCFLESLWSRRNSRSTKFS